MVDKKNNSIPGQKTNRNLFSCKKRSQRQHIHDDCRNIDSSYC